MSAFEKTLGVAPEAFDAHVRVLPLLKRGGRDVCRVYVQVREFAKALQLLRSPRVAKLSKKNFDNALQWGRFFVLQVGVVEAQLRPRRRLDVSAGVSVWRALRRLPRAGPTTSRRPHRCRLHNSGEIPEKV